MTTANINPTIEKPQNESPTEEEEEEDEKEVVNKWEGISAHGVPRVIGSHSSRMTRLFWIFVTLTACISLVILSQGVIEQYINGQTTTVISFVPREIVFPDVKICNRAWFDPAKIAADVNSTDELRQVFDDMSEDRPSNISHEILMSLDEFFLASYSTEFAMKYAFNLDDFALQCSRFGMPDIPCSQIFTPVLMADAGVCFHLNKSSQYANFDYNGRLQMFSILLYFDPKKEFGDEQPLIGGRVMIGSDNNQVIDEAIPVSPGEVVEVETTRWTWKQPQSTKSNPCHNDDLLHYSHQGIEYTKPFASKTCELICSNNFASVMYDCVAYAGFVDNETCMDVPENRRYAINPFSNTARWGFQETMDEYMKMVDCTTQCHQQCYQYVFDKRVSISGPFPKNKFLRKKLDFLATSGNAVAMELWDRVMQHENEEEQEEELTKIGKNFAKVGIYLVYDHSEKVVELVPMHTFVSFLSNIGGSMGLWMGVSIISIIEILECTLSTFYFAFFKLCGRRNTKTT